MCYRPNVFDRAHAVSCACFLKFTLVLHVLIRNLTGLSYRSTFLTFLAIRPRECQATLWKSVIGRRGESRSVAKTHEPRTRPESFNSQHSRDAERKAKFILRALFTQGVCSLESFGRWTMWLNARNCNISFFFFLNIRYLIFLRECIRIYLLEINYLELTCIMKTIK